MVGPDAAGKGVGGIVDKGYDGDEMGELIGKVGPKPVALVLRHGVGLKRINCGMGKREEGGGHQTAAEGQRGQGKDDSAVEQQHLRLALGGDHRIGLKNEIGQQVSDQAGESGGDGLFGHRNSGSW